jgi:hypothetical protein
MANRKQKASATAWRSRREEYLRASGRHSDLVKEGFESEILDTTWSVIDGGRMGRFASIHCATVLFLVSADVYGEEPFMRRRAR